MIMKIIANPFKKLKISYIKCAEKYFFIVYKFFKHPLFESCCYIHSNLLQAGDSWLKFSGIRINWCEPSATA